MHGSADSNNRKNNIAKLLMKPQHLIFVEFKVAIYIWSSKLGK